MWQYLHDWLISCEEKENEKLQVDSIPISAEIYLGDFLIAKAHDC